jgi:hypothetical protein
MNYLWDSLQRLSHLETTNCVPQMKEGNVISESAIGIPNGVAGSNCLHRGKDGAVIKGAKTLYGDSRSRSLQIMVIVCVWAMINWYLPDGPPWEHPRSHRGEEVLPIIMLQAMACGYDRLGKVF